MTPAETPRTEQIRKLLVHDQRDQLLAAVADMERELAQARAAIDAAIAYDDAIRLCANDPDKMATYCTAEGDDLDALYLSWMTKCRALRSESGQ